MSNLTQALKREEDLRQRLQDMVGLLHIPAEACKVEIRVWAPSLGWKFTTHPLREDAVWWGQLLQLVRTQVNTEYLQAMEETRRLMKGKMGET